MRRFPALAALAVGVILAAMPAKAAFFNIVDTQDPLTTPGDSTAFSLSGATDGAGGHTLQFFASSNVSILAEITAPPDVQAVRFTNRNPGASGSIVSSGGPAQELLLVAALNPGGTLGLRLVFGDDPGVEVGFEGTLSVVSQVPLPAGLPLLVAGRRRAA